MRNHLGTIQFSFTALAACAGIGAANAQIYPIRSVRIVAPFAPGGPNDILGRLVVQKLTEYWGRQVAKNATEIAAGTPEQFDAFLRGEVQKWSKVIKDAGIQTQ